MDDEHTAYDAATRASIAAYRVVKMGCARSSWDVLLALNRAAMAAWTEDGEPDPDPLTVFTAQCLYAQNNGSDVDDLWRDFHRWLDARQ